MIASMIVSQLRQEARLIGVVYSVAIILGIASAFVSAHTNFKIVTSEPPVASLPPASSFTTTPQQNIWELGFPDPAKTPTSSPTEDAIAQAPASSHAVRLVAASAPILATAPSQAPLATVPKRVAFVAGNGAYKNAAQLQSPPADANAVAVALRKVGFEVVEGTNLTRDEMTKSLLDFGKKAQGADVAVFFYAGHGIAISGTNYLLPVDADIRSEVDVKLGAAINIDLTLDQTMSDAKLKLVFLDACRDNPFAARIKSTATRGTSIQSGLAKVKPGEGTLIAFATGPGQTAPDGQDGNNSPFTRALIDHITKPGIDIQQAMTEVRAQVNEETNKEQLPWTAANLIGPVYLDPAPAPATGNASAAVASTEAGAGASDIELEFWRSVKGSNKAEELNAYLSNYPNGQFKALALARIAALENGTSPTERNLTSGIEPATFTEESNQVTEDQIGLDKGQRRDVQRRLTGLGFDAKATGKFDDDTRSAIRRWQVARGYPATGYLNRLQHKALVSEIVSASASSSSSDDSDDPPARRRSGGGGGGHRSGGGGGGGGNPGAFSGGVTGGMMGGMFRR